MNKLKEKIQDLLVDIRYGANHLQDHIFECDDICGEYIQDILDDCVLLQELIDQQIKTILEAWYIVKNKSVDIHDVIHCSSLEVFNCGLYEKYQLTEEEYNKVKKALEVQNE